MHPMFTQTTVLVHVNETSGKATHGALKHLMAEVEKKRFLVVPVEVLRVINLANKLGITVFAIRSAESRLQTTPLSATG